LNRLGAQALCQTQVSQILGRLERERLYLPKFYCPRAALEVHLSRFQASGARVLPIVGHAGVGKTTFLAHLASELSNGQPVLLLRGLAIAQGEGGLVGLIDEALQQAEQAQWRMAPSAEHLISALEGAGRELWILLDALNEARIDTLALSDLWIPESIEWLLRTRTRLILTCRNEHWQVLAGRFPKELLPQEEPASPLREKTESRAEDRREVGLGEFSDAEVESAAELYQLSFNSEERLLRHPLTLRLVWELVQESGSGELQERRLPDQGTIIDHLVTRVCERAAIRIGGRTPVARIRRAVDAIAAHMFAERRQDIPIAILDERFGYASDWFDAFVHEHLFVAAGDRYRFAFDDVGEYLQSAQISERDLANLGRLFAGEIIAHAYARVGASGRREQLRAAIKKLCAWICENRSISFAFAVARRIAPFDEAGELRRDLITSAASVDAGRTAVLYRRDAETRNLH
jgi:hypothetical protein